MPACRSPMPARRARLKEGQHIRNAVRRNDFGFTVGGPIRIPKVYNGTNKTFFFVNFEQFRETRHDFQRPLDGTYAGL